MINKSRVFGLLGLAAKAGKVQSGEFSTEKSVKSGRAYLVNESPRMFTAFENHFGTSENCLCSKFKSLFFRHSGFYGSSCQCVYVKICKGRCGTAENTMYSEKLFRYFRYRAYC